MSGSHAEASEQQIDNLYVSASLELEAAAETEAVFTPFEENVQNVPNLPALEEQQENAEADYQALLPYGATNSGVVPLPGANSTTPRLAAIYKVVSERHPFALLSDGSSVAIAKLPLKHHLKLLSTSDESYYAETYINGTLIRGYIHSYYVYEEIPNARNWVLPPINASNALLILDIAEAELDILQLEDDMGQNAPTYGDYRDYLINAAVTYLRSVPHSRDNTLPRYDIGGDHSVSLRRSDVREQKTQIYSIEDFILFVEEIEATYPDAATREIVSEIRQIWFSDANWDVLVGSEGVRTIRNGETVYEDVETAPSPIEYDFDLKHLDPSGQGQVRLIRTPMGDVDISHVIAGLDAYMNGPRAEAGNARISNYPREIIEGQPGHTPPLQAGGHVQSMAGYIIVSELHQGDVRDFTTWAGDIGQAYADYIFDVYYEKDDSQDLNHYISLKANPAALLADIHGYIIGEVTDEIARSETPQYRGFTQVSDYLRNFYMVRKNDETKEHLSGEPNNFSYMYYFEKVADKQGAELKEFILERSLAFGRAWYAKGAAKANVADFALSTLGNFGNIVEAFRDKMGDFDKYHAENETSATEENKIGSLVNDFLRMIRNGRVL
ncbi:MAG: hypothetical protein AAGG51_11130 [Cyanobacteria bacterium P01_G01_bin.54]